MDKSNATDLHATCSDLTLKDGTVLAIDRLHGHKRPVVFAHGFGQTRGAWRHCAKALAAAGHGSLAYDARGHGGSTWNRAHAPYDPIAFTDDLIAVTGQLEPPPVLVGASMGGLFGLLAESRWPGLFSAMVLVDITPRWETKGVERILTFMSAHPDGFDSYSHAADAIAQYLPHRERKSENALRAVLREDANGRLRWHWDPRLLNDIGRDADRHQAALAEATRHVHCPVLLLSGGRSDLVSDDTIDEFLQLVPHAQHHRLPAATHMVAGDDNDAFTTTVMQYLDALPVFSTVCSSANTHLTGAFQ